MIFFLSTSEHTTHKYVLKRKKQAKKKIKNKSLTVDVDIAIQFIGNGFRNIYNHNIDRKKGVKVSARNA